jgi:hypothetical protein
VGFWGGRESGAGRAMEASATGRGGGGVSTSRPKPSPKEMKSVGGQVPSAFVTPHPLSGMGPKRGKFTE